MKPVKILLFFISYASPLCNTAFPSILSLQYILILSLFRALFFFFCKMHFFAGLFRDTLTENRAYFLRLL